MCRMEQSELAERLGMSIATVRRMESGFGVIDMKISTLHNLLNIFENEDIEFIDADEHGGVGVRSLIAKDGSRILRLT